MTNEQLVETIKALREAGATRIVVEGDSVTAEFGEKPEPTYVPVYVQPQPFVLQPVFVPYVQPPTITPGWPRYEPFWCGNNNTFDGVSSVATFTAGSGSQQ